MDVEIVRQFHTCSDPNRDPRHHTITTVFIARARGRPSAGDDVKAAGVFRRDNLPEQIAFDHMGIINDYYSGRF